MKISVIIPVYNASCYLDASVTSVVRAAQVASSQGVKVEIVLIDDGSTDGSSELLVGLAGQKIDGVTWQIRHQANSGVGSARNLGIRCATGDWLLFVDADDKIAETTFARLHEVVCDAVDMIGFGYQTLLEGVTVFEEEQPNGRGEVRDLTGRLEYGIFWRNFWTCCYRRSIVPETGFPPYVVGEDLVFLAGAFVKARRMVELPDKLYGYRIHQGSAIHSGMTLRKLSDYLQYNHERIGILNGSSKRIDPLIYRRIGLELTENAVVNILQMTKKEKKKAWEHWYCSLDRCRSHSHLFTQWTRWVIVICRWLPLRIVAYGLCGLPYRLKVLGLHR